MSLRIVVVDDDANTRNVVSLLLRREGHVADAIGSGAEALEHLRASPCDVLVTDLVMPGMDGRALVEAATSLNPRLRCFIMSGHARPDDEQVTAVWVDKPIDMAAFLEHLQGDAGAGTEG